MCGIVGYVGYRDCSDVLVSALSKLEYRGYDSAGIAVFENGEIKVAKSKGRLKDLEEKMQTLGKPQGHAGIGHTRWATHGEPSDRNSHPHSGEKVSIVHNGIIENYKDLKEFLLQKGQEFLSDTDTEVVARLLGYYYDGDPLRTIIRAVHELEGSFGAGHGVSGFSRRCVCRPPRKPADRGRGQGRKLYRLRRPCHFEVYQGLLPAGT